MLLCRKITNNLFSVVIKLSVVFVVSTIFIIMAALISFSIDSLTIENIHMKTLNKNQLINAINNQEKNKITEIIASDLKKIGIDSFFDDRYYSMADFNQADGSYIIKIPSPALNQNNINMIKAVTKVTEEFRYDFFTNNTSSKSLKAGIFSAFCGTIFTACFALFIAIPLSLSTAIYLVEFSKKNIISKIIEINLFNLASIPSVIYGVIGFVLYLQILEMNRSSVIVGALTLMLMCIPHLVIIYAQALKSVPQSVRDASLALGANKIQTLYYHIFRYSLPGIITGTILTLSRIAGETAPLLLIGMVAFVSNTPDNLFMPTTTIASQIFLWTESPDPVFVKMASAGIVTLLSILFVINLFAQAIKKKLTIKWP